MATIIRSTNGRGIKKPPAFTCLFVDIGGVLLTNGWDRPFRKQAAREFKLDFDEMESRHCLTYGTYEEGKLSLKEYLAEVVFYKKRTFTPEQFWDFMTAQSKAFPRMIDLIGRLKAQYQLKIAVVSNEARDLNAFRIQTFGLSSFVDFYISSCYVHFRKPDAEIFRLALDIAQVRTNQIVYIENTPMFVQIAESLGIRSILHTGYQATRDQLAALGLALAERGIERS